MDFWIFKFEKVLKFLILNVYLLYNVSMKINLHTNLKSAKWSESLCTTNDNTHMHILDVT